MTHRSGTRKYVHESCFSKLEGSALASACDVICWICTNRAKSEHILRNRDTIAMSCSEECKKTYTEFYSSGICKTCENYSSDLSKCSRCKNVNYCSVNCQKKDWKRHKKVCSESYFDTSDHKCILCKCIIKDTAFYGVYVYNKMYKGSKYTDKYCSNCRIDMTRYKCSRCSKRCEHRANTEPCVFGDGILVMNPFCSVGCRIRFARKGKRITK